MAARNRIIRDGSSAGGIAQRMAARNLGLELGWQDSSTSWCRGGAEKTAGGRRWKEGKRRLHLRNLITPTQNGWEKDEEENERMKGRNEGLVRANEKTFFFLSTGGF